MPRIPSDRNRLLAGLPAADFALLAPHLIDESLSPRIVIQEAGSFIEHVYFLHAGFVSLLMSVPNRPAIEIAMIGREGAVGLNAGIGSQIALNQAMTQSPVDAGRISGSRLSDVAEHSKPVRDMVVRYNDVLKAQIQHMAVCNAVHEVEARLSRWLLQARDRIDSNEVKITQESLAALLCVRRTTVVMICKTLQDRGVIHSSRGCVNILDGSALERGACACYRQIANLL
jgi:CRP-like cAMP-binding protein